MWIPTALALLLFGVIHQAAGSGHVPPPQPTCRDASVTAFSAAFYTAVLLSNDPDIFFSLELSSHEASALIYKVDQEELKRFDICNAVIAAKTVAKGVTFLPVFNLPVFFQLKAITVGEYLAQQGFLNCDNALELAYEYFIQVQGILDDLDATAIESYMYAVIRGLIELAIRMELDLPQTSHDLAYIFYYVFKEGK